MFGLSIDHGIARIALGRGEARNAVRIEDWAVLGGCLDKVQSSGARVLILESAIDGIFCAGADLKEIVTLEHANESRRALRLAMGDAVYALSSLDAPTLAVIDGGCFGAGVALAMACDIRLAGPRAQFAIPPAKLGIVYPYGDVERLVARVGTSQAVLLLASGDTIDADEAARIGLVDRRAEHVAVEAAALARRIAENSFSSVKSLKQMATNIFYLDEADYADITMTVGDRVFEDSFGSPDFAEGAAALREKRKPVFRG